MSGPYTYVGENTIDYQSIELCWILKREKYPNDIWATRKFEI